MAHPKRDEFIPYLKKVLGYTTPMAYDKDSKGLLWNCLEAWKLYDKSADYHCVIQDDVLFATDFKERVQQHVEFAHNQTNGEVALILCMMNRPRFRKNVREAKRDGKNYTWLEHLHTGNSIILPVKYIEEMMEFYKTLTFPLDDKRIDTFVSKKGLKVYCPLPNLIEHRKEPSLHNYNKSSFDSRVSIWFDK
jgi:GR25 family glycosyltransferase involved in LPS biosynthesis